MADCEARAIVLASSSADTRLSWEGSKEAREETGITEERGWVIEWRETMEVRRPWEGEVLGKRRLEGEVLGRRR